jgi:hypothetical protein
MDFFMAAARQGRGRRPDFSRRKGLLPQTAQAGDELIGVNRFGKELEVVALLLGAAHQLAGGSLAGKEKDAGLGELVAQANAEIDTRHARHKHVAEDDIGMKAPSYPEGVFAAQGLHGVKTMSIQDGGDGLGDQGLIVHDEHAQDAAADVGAIALREIVQGRRRPIDGQEGNRVQQG